MIFSLKQSIGLEIEHFLRTLFFFFFVNIMSCCGNNTAHELNSWYRNNIAMSIIRKLWGILFFLKKKIYFFFFTIDPNYFKYSKNILFFNIYPIVIKIFYIYIYIKGNQNKLALILQAQSRKPKKTSKQQTSYSSRPSPTQNPKTRPRIIPNPTTKHPETHTNPSNPLKPFSSVINT